MSSWGGVSLKTWTALLFVSMLKRMSAREYHERIHITNN
jgi:hypothetical protein